MKKITMILFALLISASLFAQVSGSVGSTSVYDADAETIAETIATSVSIGPLTIANSFIFTQILDETEFDWTGAIDYALNAAISLGVSATYGIDSESLLPITLSGSWKIADFFTISASYTNDNLNPEEADGITPEVEIGSFTITGTFTF